MKDSSSSETTMQPESGSIQIAADLVQGHIERRRGDPVTRAFDKEQSSDASEVSTSPSP